MSESAAATLLHHRAALAKNAHAYTQDWERVQRTAVAHLKKCGFGRVTLARCKDLVIRFAELIFDTQDRKPFFHVDGPLPYCWNAPKDWDKDYIRYEWGHLRSRNQNSSGANTVENLCLQSARCNQHIQTSLNIEEVFDWLMGSPVAKRTSEVLDRRAALFASEEWRVLLRDLEKYRTPSKGA
jgi:hypothetical protein